VSPPSLYVHIELGALDKNNSGPTYIHGLLRQKAAKHTTKQTKIHN